MWLDREALAYAFLGLALAWIVWIDLRPFLRARLGRDVKDCLRVGAFHVADYLIDANNPNNIGLRLKFMLHNDSQDTGIYMIMRRSHLSVDGRVNPKAETKMPITRIAPQSYREITLALVPFLENKALYGGNVDLEFDYGAKEKRLRFRLKYEGVLDIKLIPMNENQGKYDIDTSHRRMEHEALL